MVNALRVEINVIAVVILLLLLFSRKRIEKSLLDEWLFQKLIILTCAYAITDSIAWSYEGVPGTFAYVLLYFTNTVGYLFTVLIPYVWIMYCNARLFEDEERLHRLSRYLIPPMIFFALLVLSNPFTGCMFTISSSNFYQRGPLFLLQIALSSIYTIFPTFNALERLKSATMKAERMECYIFGVFVLVPIIGSIIQTLFYGLPAAIISASLSELMIFINVQNKQISLDALTRINNRGQLNRFLSQQVKRNRTDKKLYMMIMDIDFFKSINDTYGHKEGDQAIIDVAGILQKACGKNGGFLARYGGDEFAILVEKATEEEMHQFETDIQVLLKQFNQDGGRKYKLSLSIGYAEYGTDQTPTADKLLEEADNQMYLMKQKRHKENIDLNKERG